MRPARNPARSSSHEASAPSDAGTQQCHAKSVPSTAAWPLAGEALQDSPASAEVQVTTSQSKGAGTQHDEAGLSLQHTCTAQIWLCLAGATQLHSTRRAPAVASRTCSIPVVRLRWRRKFLPNPLPCSQLAVHPVLACVLTQRANAMAPGRQLAYARHRQGETCVCSACLSQQAG